MSVIILDRKSLFKCIIICLAITLTISCVYLFTARNLINNNPYNQVYFENLWPITLPKDMTLLCSDTDHGWDGFIVFAIFDAKSSPQEMIKKAQDSRAQLSKKSFVSRVKFMTNALIPQYYMPDFEQEFEFALMSRRIYDSPSLERTYYLFIMYFENTNRLLLVHENSQWGIF